jgi:hypothetical protein
MSDEFDDGRDDPLRLHDLGQRREARIPAVRPRPRWLDRAERVVPAAIGLGQALNKVDFPTLGRPTIRTSNSCSSRKRSGKVFGGRPPADRR